MVLVECWFFSVYLTCGCDEKLVFHCLAGTSGFSNNYVTENYPRGLEKP